jgi:hypothetical protein
MGQKSHTWAPLSIWHKMVTIFLPKAWIRYRKRIRPGKKVPDQLYPDLEPLFCLRYRGRTTQTGTGRVSGSSSSGGQGRSWQYVGDNSGSRGPSGGGGWSTGCSIAWSQGAAGVAMSTTAVATFLLEDHISMVAAVAEAPEATPVDAVPPDEAVTVTRQPPLRSKC